MGAETAAIAAEDSRQFVVENLERLGIVPEDEEIIVPPAATSEPVTAKAHENEETPPTPPYTDDGLEKDPQFALPPPSVDPPKVLDIDLDTPDKHVRRDPRLIRLTGVHPFNVEAPLTDLFNSGFLTPPELFYVRNHGPVPQVMDEEMANWEVSIEGLVEKPMKITVRQIIEDFEQLTLPVTLVCAGNRRKEQNVVRKSQGFSWGPAGLSTCLFTGPTLLDVINAAKPMRNAKYVCMEGADKLPNGFYGTSVRMSWVRDPSRGIMLAHKMNGEDLRPDHGRPMRVVVPGQIGGRSVKWLTKLILSDNPSTNWYHIYDNRVLPTMITPELGKKEPKWWYDERYAIFDLNVNSAIACPAHNETLDTSLNTGGFYTLKGYAYGGGGRRVTRVEISLDKGATWRLSDIDYPEDRYREITSPQYLYGGRVDMEWRDFCNCWCFWSINVPYADLDSASCSDIVLRAMDEAMNLQPRDMYWSILGMMNNPWFRVKLLKDANKPGHITFEHPTQPALMPGGWMEKVKKAGGNLLDGYWGEGVDGMVKVEKAGEKKDEVKMINDEVKRIIELDEFKAHDKAEEPWFVVKGEVFDGTAFLEGHPGGKQSIISASAQDATEEFMAIHSESAQAMMPKYHIGTLSPAARKALADGDDSMPVSDTPRELFLNSRYWIPSTLIGKKAVSWDTRIFTFQLEHEDQLLGLPVGQHLMIRVKDAGADEAIIRPYTPLSDAETTKGVVDVLVKVYFKTNDSPGGKMTQALDRLSIGQSIDLKGPIGKLEYLGRGRVCLNGTNSRHIRSFLMICAGSGITPIFQVLRAVMKDSEDRTHCTVLNSNRLEEDILCREELERWNAGNENCKLVMTLTKPPVEWYGLKGRITKEFLVEHMPANFVCTDTGKERRPLALVCGPEGMEKATKSSLIELGFSEDDMVFF